MKNNTFEEIWEKLRKAENILIPLHPRPDGDSLGICAAMGHVLRGLGKEVILISKDELSDNLKGFDFIKEIEFGRNFEDYDLENFDVLLFLDHGSLQGYPEEIQKKEFPKNTIVINIDHHETNNYFGNLNYVNTESPSCCSVLVEFLQKLNVDFEAELSKRLFLGICTDTYFFVHGDSLDSIKKAEFLIEKGKIDYAKDFFEPINSNPWNIKKLYGIILSNMKKKRIRGVEVAYSFVLQEDIQKYGLNEAEIRLGIMCVQDIKDIPLVFTLTELKDKIKGSFRSRGIDTSLLSKELGGGGHKQASAFLLEKMPMEKAINSVLEIIERVGIHKA